MRSKPSHKGKANKGKAIMPEGSDHQRENSIQPDNWLDHEITNLINAIDEIQNRRGKVGFRFNHSENQQIYDLFIQGMPDSTRAKEIILKRMKVLVKMFRICDDLAKRSGGGWDDNTHRPIAPSVDDYIEMVRAKGEPGGFLITSNFPWYRKMVTMVGGQNSKGKDTCYSWGLSEPIDKNTGDLVMGSQTGLECSEQGSSDDPDDEGKYGATDQYETVQQPNRRGGSSFNAKGQSSQGVVRKSANSGSKRKSTDDSSEQNTRGQRYKSRYQARQKEEIEVAKVGLEIARVMEKDHNLIAEKSGEMKEAAVKLAELKSMPAVYKYCFNNMAEPWFRSWFLESNREDIIWLVTDTIEEEKSK